MKYILPELGVLICFLGGVVAYLVAITINPILAFAYPIVVWAGIIITYGILWMYFPSLIGKVKWWGWIIVILLITIFLVIISK